MELSAYELVKKIHKILSVDPKQGGTAITDAEIAYITGLLEALLMTYNPDPTPTTTEQKHTFLDGVKDKLGV